MFLLVLCSPFLATVLTILFDVFHAWSENSEVDFHLQVMATNVKNRLPSVLHTGAFDYRNEGGNSAFCQINNENDVGKICTSSQQILPHE
jgi:hypothetical protein